MHELSTCEKYLRVTRNEMGIIYIQYKGIYSGTRGGAHSGHQYDIPQVVFLSPSVVSHSSLISPRRTRSTCSSRKSANPIPWTDVKSLPVPRGLTDTALSSGVRITEARTSRSGGKDGASADVTISCGLPYTINTSLIAETGVGNVPLMGFVDEDRKNTLPDDARMVCTNGQFLSHVAAFPEIHFE